jgi:hypothetical protein
LRPSWPNSPVPTPFGRTSGTFITRSHPTAPPPPLICRPAYRGPIGPKGGPLPDAWRIDPSCAEGAHGNCAHCAKDPAGQFAHRALQELPNHSAMPLAGLARAKVDQVPRTTPSRCPEASASFPVSAPPTGLRGRPGPHQTPIPAHPLPSPGSPRSRLSAITPRPSKRPSTTWPPLWMHAQTQPRGQRTNSPAPVTPGVQRKTTSPASTRRPR